MSSAASCLNGAKPTNIGQSLITPGRVKMRDMKMWNKTAGIENATQGPMESQ